MKPFAPAALAMLTLLAARADAVEVTDLPLWEGAAPPVDQIGHYEGRGDSDRPDRWLTGVTKPVVSVYRPDAGDANGAAVVIFPGGGYGGQAIDKEGHFVARWLAERGLVGVVVPYRCGGGENRHPAPLADARRAVRLVRSHASDWGVDPAKVGVMGFSAGGHLAATAATLYDAELPGVEDSLSDLSARPDFAVLVYPVVSMRAGVTHNGSRRNLLGDEPTEELIALLSADEQVTAETPPTLLVHAVDDGSVQLENPQRFFEACRRHGVPVETHLFETGGHGFGMWATQGATASWPTLLEGWLAAHTSP